MQDWWEEVWNSHNEDRIRDWVAHDCRIYGLSPEPMIGPEPFLEFHRTMHRAMPNIHVEALYHVVEDDKACSILVCHGKHTGELMGYAPTGKPVVFNAIVFARWRDGKIVEGRNMVDLADALAKSQSSL